MKHRMTWPVLLLLQAVAVGLVTTGSVFAVSAAPGLYLVGMWGAIPLLGALSAYFCARRGLNNYAAWWVPPVVSVCAHWAWLGMPPSSAAMPMVTALVSVVGAAAADEKNRREEKRQRDKLGK